MKGKVCGAIGLSCMIMAAAAFAHHSAAMFDLTKRIKVEGTVKDWQWTNPHSWLQVLVSDGKGGWLEEGFELGSPNTLVRDGFKKNSFTPGDKVTVVAAPRKDGSVGGFLVQVRTASGEWLRWGRGADAAAAAAAGVPSQ